VLLAAEGRRGASSSAGFKSTTDSAGTGMLETLVRNLAAKMDTMQSSIDVLKEDNKALDAKVETMKKDVNDLRIDVKTLRKDVNGLTIDVKEVLTFQGETFEAAGNGKGVHILRQEGRRIVLPGASITHFRVGKNLRTIRPLIDLIQDMNKREQAWAKLKRVWSKKVYSFEGTESQIKDFEIDSCSLGAPVILRTEAGYLQKVVQYSGEYKMSTSLENLSKAVYQTLFFPALLTWVCNGIVGKEEQLTWLAAPVLRNKIQEAKLAAIRKKNGEPFSDLDRAAQCIYQILEKGEMLFVPKLGEANAVNRINEIEEILKREIAAVAPGMENLAIPEAVLDGDVKNVFLPYTAVQNAVVQGDDTATARAKAGVGLLASFKVQRALEQVIIHIQSAQTKDVLQNI
jgi:outer membrane murein-binding lipoprotein Lpp